MKKFIKKGWRKVATRPSFRKVNEFIFECSLNGLGILNFENSEISGERFFVERLLPLYLPDSNPVLIDVGSNVGDYTSLFLSTHVDASVWAFEPNPKIYLAVEKRMAGKNVIVENMGLGLRKSILKFYDRKDQGGASSHGSLYRDVIEDIHGEDSVEFEVLIDSLDSYSDEHKIGHINLLKIDTEGHELEVLKGSLKLINEGRIDLVHIEFNEMNIVSRVFFRDFTKILNKYIPFRLLPKGVIKLKNSPVNTELFAFQNIVFVHKDFDPDESMQPFSTRNGNPF